MQNNRPFNGTAQTWGILGNLAEDIGMGAQGFFKTQRMLEDDLERKRMNALKMREMQHTMDLQDKQEGRSAALFDRNIDKEQASALLTQSQSAFRNRQFDAAKNLSDEYLKRYNNLFDAHRVGAKFHMTPGELQVQGPSMTPGGNLGTVPNPDGGRIDWKNPFNVRALAELTEMGAKDPQFMQTADGIISITPTGIPGQAPEVQNVYTPQPKPLSMRDRLLVVGDSALDVTTGQWYSDPVGALRASKSGGSGGSGGGMTAYQAAMLADRLADNGRADKHEANSMNIARANAYQHTFTDAIAAGYPPEQAASMATNAMTAFNHLVGAGTGAAQPGAVPAGGGAPGPAGGQSDRAKGRVAGYKPGGTAPAAPAARPATPGGLSDRAKARAAKYGAQK